MPPADVTSEIDRVQRACDFAAEWQVTAAGFWTNVQLFLGGAAAALAAVSSGSAFSDQDVLAGTLAAAAALAAAVLASLRPQERAAAHQAAAAAYHALAVEARLARDNLTPRGDDTLASLETRKVELDTSSPWAPRRLAKKTEGFLRKGRRYYDNEGPDLTAARNPDGGRA